MIQMAIVSEPRETPPLASHARIAAWGDPGGRRDSQRPRGVDARPLACALALASLMLATAGCPDQPANTAASERDSPGLADRIRSKLSTCSQVSKGLFKTDEGQKTPPEIAICSYGEAIFWRADMDIDCDGKVTTHCNSKADPDFQPQTSAVTSTGEYLEAESVPYVVIPRPSDRFDHAAAGVHLGAVVMVVYGDKIEYGVFADTGPAGIIGEASYAMAKRLGIDPDPSTGGTDETVLYVAFKGKASVPARLEDHAEAVRVGQARTKAVFADLMGSP